MKVLVVDDEKNIREIIRKVLELENIECKTAENGLSAQRLISENSFDILVSDLKMPGMDGQELLEWIQKSGLSIPVIMISAFGQADDAVKALKNGAADYIVKPFDPDELIHRILKVHKSRIMEQKILLENKDNESYLTQSSSMKLLKQKMLRVAPTPSTILITGESGSGKEVSARFIHQNSRGAENPFLSINIGGIPESLLESELFGCEKGAFTGAEKVKSGLFELASGGTLFLDEIGEMPMSLQVKLLRVLQEKTIRRLGGITDLPIRARIIAATNRNLEEEIKNNRFREDLYYRLNVVQIALLPLRERREDILPLSSILLKKLNKKMGTKIQKISSETMNWLETYNYPGNIRELENILERGCIFSEGNELSLQYMDLPLIVNSQVNSAASGTIKEMEKQMIEKSLQKWEGNRTKAAKELGISRKTILNKIKEYCLNN